MTRSELQETFITLRNSKLSRPSTSNTRLYNLYLDYLNDSDRLANLRTDEELLTAIQTMLSK